LEKEGIISSHNRRPFKIPLVKGWPPIKIIPNLVVHLPNGEKVLVEIANPRDPKRFLGEIVYPHLLRHHKKIKKQSFLFYTTASVKKSTIEVSAK